MNTTILNYPGFQTLPKGIKQMLVVSEAHFFEQPAPCHKQLPKAPLHKWPRWLSLGSANAPLAPWIQCGAGGGALLGANVRPHSRHATLQHTTLESIG